MKPCPSFNQTSSSGRACFWCAAVKLPSATNPRVYFQFSGSWGFVFQSSGRLTPGCGQVGQKKPISPGIGAVPLCPNPKVANSLRLRYCLPTLINSWYRFCENLWLKFTLLDWTTYRNGIGKCKVGDSSQFGVVVSGRRFAFKIFQKVVVQQFNPEQL